MANLIRYAKSGSDWTQNDLDAYNINVRLENATAFFGVEDLPPPSIDQEVLTTLDAANMASVPNAVLINLLDLAMAPEPNGESAVDDFAVALFTNLGYVNQHRVARTRKNIPFLICGERRYAKADVCLIDRRENDILLVVQEDKRFREDPLAVRCQLIAEAIAAFSYSNGLRESAGLEPLESKIMPGIVLVGTTPTFYKIPVTAELARHIAHGTYPVERTVVSSHVPDLPRPTRRYSEGMKPLDNRQAILRCYEAFKRVVGI
ncbi:uncharacterized protein LAESUDRAFT_657346 [Laetiporus sulphureus 93-53]|uniref:Uncharacterized protein n=1 Tax=Laetiporus sulphureus 93-53 TaxID=1314785 RepID=A0A165DF01_9APHY|nr:uncharacterized protein LAESUDRAFT_657346 [Laetiporus sulphureus 93-53]KZT04744.1 hypothetical protein LAESUDRAFT_657346 [Laetiporus sulphureus 93-53]